MPGDLAASMVILIPAYRPAAVLPKVVDQLIASGAQYIVVVDDGSGPEYDAIFHACAKPEVRMLKHAINMGKGAALKTGLNYVLCECPDGVGVVTADADGQHAPADIMRIGRALADYPDALILGARQFDSGVPARSRFGNQLTRTIVRYLVGQKLTDTQTGLRGIPRELMFQLLRSAASGYEFELDMLMMAKHHAYTIRELPIQTIYEAGNKSSHFNPLVDSMRIYFVLLRFSFLSIASAVLDNCVFYVAYRVTSDILHSQIVARIASVGFNYAFARRTVFQSNQGHKTVLPRYLALVLVSGTLSYALIELITQNLPVQVIVAKIIAESIVFFLNFVVQRDFIFTRRARTTDIKA